MARVRVLILTAVFPEARALARAFDLVEAGKGGGLWIKGELALAVVGMRGGLLGDIAGVEELSGIQVIIMAGVAGALSPALEVGDVVVDAREVKEELPAMGRAFLGRLYTSTGLVGTQWQKAELFASTRCLAVDMETDVAAAFARERRAAFVGIRGISDRADAEVDPAFFLLVDAAGQARVGRAIGLLCRHPTKLRAMLRLGRATSKAMAAVCGTIGELFASGWQGRESDRRTGG